jgi:hypothetical protein
VSWSDLEPKPLEAAKAQNYQTETEALAKACVRALAKDTQMPLRLFLQAKANSVSFRPGIPAEDVAFREGQRSLALQLLKLAGEIT